MMEELQKLKYFVLGCSKLVVATDHKPLGGVLKGQSSDINNPRLLMIDEKTV